MPLVLGRKVGDAQKRRQDLQWHVWAILGCSLIFALMIVYQPTYGWRWDRLGWIAPVGLPLAVGVWTWNLCRRIGNAREIETVFSVDEKGVFIQAFAEQRRLFGRRWPWQKVRAIERDELGFDLILEGATNRFPNDGNLSGEAKAFALAHARGKH